MQPRAQQIPPGEYVCDKDACPATEESEQLLLSFLPSPKKDQPRTRLAQFMIVRNTQKVQLPALGGAPHAH
jgi:hypothetical protein